MVATDPQVEEASVNLEIARQFASEKNLEMVVCSLDDQDKVEDTFLQLIDTVMMSWEEGIGGGNFTILL